MSIAKSLSGILQNPVVEVALNKCLNIDAVVQETLESWQVNLTDRNPAPAYTEGIDGEPIYQGTDLDAFTFFMALAERQAVINLPKYMNLRKKTSRSDQSVISSENRHGKLLGIVSNQKTHAFSVKIFDYNVVQDTECREEVGTYRNFSMVDDFGNWHKGFESIEFKASDEEEAFMNEKNLQIDDTIEFSYFVHPSLASAFTGARYLATKILEERVADEKKHYKDLAETLISQGIRLSEHKYDRNFQYNSFAETENFDKVKDKVLEAKVTFPDFKGDYPLLGKTRNGIIVSYSSEFTAVNECVLRYALNRKKELTKVQSQLRASARAVEMAFFLHGFEVEKSPGTEIKPGWKIPDWIRDYKESGKRVKWNALPLTDEVNLLYRIKNITVQIPK